MRITKLSNGIRIHRTRGDDSGFEETILAYGEVQAERALRMVEEAAKLPTVEREGLLLRADMLLESVTALRRMTGTECLENVARTERRTFTHGSSEQERTQGKGGVITGYAAVFFSPGNPGTEYRLAPEILERIDRGAFDRALREKDDVRALFNHRSDFVLGRTSPGTLRLSIDARGLRYAIDVGSTTIGQDVLQHVRRGDVTGSSFAFFTDMESWTDDGPQSVRTVESVTLLDVGPCTYPAYTGATAGIGP